MTREPTEMELRVAKAICHIAKRCPRCGDRRKSPTPT